MIKHLSEYKVGDLWVGDSWDDHELKENRHIVDVGKVYRYYMDFRVGEIDVCEYPYVVVSEPYGLGSGTYNYAEAPSLKWCISAKNNGRDPQALRGSVREIYFNEVHQVYSFYYLWLTEANLEKAKQLFKEQIERDYKDALKTANRYERLLKQLEEQTRIKIW